MAMAQALTQGQLIGSHFPLYPAMILVARLAMKTDVAALVVPAIFHVLFILVVYKILGALGVDRPFLYALFVAFFPPAIMIYSSSALSDSTTLFFAGLTFYYGLVNRRNLMLLSSILAAASHYMGMLLVVPLLYWFWKNDKKKSILALIPLAPIALFSLIQFFTIGDLLHYVTIHFAYAVRVWGTPLFSYPFASLVSIVMNLKGIGEVVLVWLRWSSFRCVWNRPDICDQDQKDLVSGSLHSVLRSHGPVYWILLHTKTHPLRLSFPNGVWAIGARK